MLLRSTSAQEDPFDHSDAGFETAMAGLALVVGGVAVTSPIWLPIYLIETNENGLARFQAYPYQDGGGYIRFEDDTAPVLRDWSLQAMTDYGHDFDATHRIGARFHVDTCIRFGIDSEWAWYHQGGWVAPDANLTVGDLNICYRFAQSRHAQWWIGAGTSCIYDEIRQDWGCNFTYGLDIFLGQPWILSASLDYAEMGSDDIFHARTTIGATWRVTEAFIGYDYLDTGSPEIGTAILGLRVWF